MIDYRFTKNQQWLNAWDGFVLKNNRGSHLALTDWLKSYRSYGFRYEIAIVVQDDEIIGGAGVVIPTFWWLKFFIIPHGPIFSIEHEHLMGQFLERLYERAKTIGACYMQFSLPISNNEIVMTHTYDLDMRTSIGRRFTSGKLFKHVYSSYGLNWVDFYNHTDPDSFLEQLSPKVRRNIRMPYNKGAKAYFATELEQLEKGYAVIVENAQFGGYQVRAFNEFKSTLLDLIAKQMAYFVICEVDGQIKAAAFFVKSSGYITNIMGGVLRDKPDIKLGYMLQWEMIKKSFELGFGGYNISMGGSSGVQEFKSRFGAEVVKYDQPHFHVIVNTFYFSIFNQFNARLKPYKKRISVFLKHL